MLDPNLQKLLMLILLPQWLKLSVESAEERRQNERKDIVEPKLTKSKTEQLSPHLIIDLILKLEPSEAKEKILMQDPIRVWFLNERELPNLVRPKTE